MAKMGDTRGALSVRPVASGSTRWQRVLYSDHFWGWLFVLPTTIGLILFSAGPIVAALLISLSHWNIVSAPSWVGLQNYTTLVNTSLFWTALRNTLTYMLGVIPLQMGLSLLIALGLNQRLHLQNLFRTLYFMP